ncbi:hypothetical protein M2390_002428 [Mycetocola sp. BIGb0189]|uniref:Ltp family lipoprotein n=1 Tax=Mycetocola sp. BIGb0189 TaxID=2940604 RepID=UPI00216A0AC8|nr:Ltp family lipoprotein [Mycetocola sp. BIGb0189]MCS4277224.1 hypothetical protein [Mycetocola sp. BIGb0189]
MTTPENPNTPNPEYPQGTPETAPVTAGATATLSAPAPKAPSGLALGALLVGIGSILVASIPVLGILAAVAAIVLAVLALRKGQSKGKTVTGLVFGVIALIWSLTAAISGGGNSDSTAPAKPAASAVAEAPASEEAAAVDAAETEPAKPAKETKEPEAPAVPAEFKSALKKSDSYVKIMHMSKAGLYDQLTSEYGEKFSAEAAQYAVDNVQADWNANALAKAKTYQDQMSMSPSAIRDQLVSEYGEKFTPEEADYAVANLNG